MNMPKYLSQSAYAKDTEEQAPTVLITGASKGLGCYLAESFWSAGYSLILISRNLESLNNLSHKLSNSITDESKRITPSQKISVYACDLADSKEIDYLIKRLYSLHKSVDILINNAAIQGPVGKTHELWGSFPEPYLESIQVNLLAPIELSSRLIPLMTDSKIRSPHSGGSIINISGGGAAGPRANFSAYATAKAGLVRYSETLAEEVKDLGIRVNCIAPGAMKTAMMQEVLDKGVQFAGAAEFATAQKIMSEGGASMERVAELALYLAGPDSTGITGKLISAMWDNWPALSGHTEEIKKSDIFTLRRIAGRDRGMPWADL